MHKTDPPAFAVGNLNLNTFLGAGIGMLDNNLIGDDLGGHATT